MGLSRLRVIAGIAKGRKLNLVPGESTRPITDRVKESLFNILRPDLPGSNFLDLFAGTGSVGIEALSRGAEFARFIDINNKAIATVSANLESTGFTDKGETQNLDAFRMIAKRPDKEFDYIYIAPPQFVELSAKMLLELDSNPEWLVQDGWVIVQIHPKEYNEIELRNLSEFDQRKYGNTLLVFYERVND